MQDTWSLEENKIKISKVLAWRLTSLVNVETKNVVTRCVWMFESPLKL